MTFKMVGGGKATGRGGTYYEEKLDPKRSRGVDEYYGKEPLSAAAQWHALDEGSNDSRFHQAGTPIQRGEIQSALDGYGADGSKLVQDPKHGERVQGYDLTHSAPKSYTVAFMAAPPEVQREMLGDMMSATKASITSLHEDADLFGTRRGKDGLTKERAAHVDIALIPEISSKAGQPQLHVHALVVNACSRSDSTTGALHVRDHLAKWQSHGSAIFRAELAHSAGRHGLAVERDGQFFEVKGVPAGLCQEWSQRRRDVLANTRAQGLRGADKIRAQQHAARTSRDGYTRMTGEGLEAAWQFDLDRHGGAERVWQGAQEAARGHERTVGDPGQAALAEALNAVLRSLSVASGG